MGARRMRFRLVQDDPTRSHEGGDRSKPSPGQVDICTELYKVLAMMCSYLGAR